MSLILNGLSRFCPVKRNQSRFPLALAPIPLGLASEDFDDFFFSELFSDFELLLLLLLLPWGVGDKDVVGARVVGDTVGAIVVGEFVGEIVGVVVGTAVVGEFVGDIVVGAFVGEFVGVSVGTAVVGKFVGDFVGVLVGERLVVGADVSPFSDLLFFAFLLFLLDFEEGVGNRVI